MLLLILAGEFQAIMFHLFSTQYTFIWFSAVYTVSQKCVTKNPFIVYGHF